MAKSTGKALCVLNTVVSTGISEVLLILQNSFH